jgi:hypothetical protein
MPVNQDQSPNFRQDGQLFLVRCFQCKPEGGRENLAIAVANGECAHCGWRDAMQNISAEAQGVR